MINKVQTNFHTYFFLVSYPISMRNGAEVLLGMKHQSIQPLRKLLEKTFKLADGDQDYIVNVYAGDIFTYLLKDKEIQKSQNNQRTFPVKILLKIQKNKFESILHPLIDFDYFMNIVKFDPIKKLIGKSIDPPRQIELIPFQYLSLFSEALIKDKHKLNDPTYLEFLRYGFRIIQSLGTVPFNLFLLIYDKILNSENLELLKSILDFFQINKIEKQKNLQELNIFQETLIMIYDAQKKYIENIKKIPGVNFLLFLIKFYTTIILYHSTMNDYHTVESIMMDLRDKNPYDNLILSKIFLSDYNYFYRNLPINLDLKMSLIDSYIIASNNYENLLTAFSMITEYINGDFNSTLLILIKNFDKIYEICSKCNRPLKVNDYIIQKNEDNLSQIQNSLTILGQQKINCGFKVLDFKINMWDIYFEDGYNRDFFIFLKSNLIQSSLDLEEVKEALGYIIKYTRKDLVEMMEVFVKNYDRLEVICQKEKKYINAIDYLDPRLGDRIDAIQENLDFLISRKLKANFETIFFKIDIWLFYIINRFNQEFLLYLEKKLYEGAIYFDDITDFITYGSTLRDKTFNLVLKFIIQNFEKINRFASRKKVSIEFTNYFTPREDSDNLEEIYNLFIEIIEKEKKVNFKTFNFPMNIWKPYSLSQDLDYLRLIRKTIIKLTEMDETLDENTIGLGKKIHKVGFQYIRMGKLKGDRLLEFLGFEESFFVEGEIKSINETNEYQQSQLDYHAQNINELHNKTKRLQERLDICNSEISFLKAENNNLKSRVHVLEKDVNNLYSRVKDCENDIDNLKARTGTL